MKEIHLRTFGYIPPWQNSEGTWKTKVIYVTIYPKYLAMSTFILVSCRLFSHTHPSILLRTTQGAVKNSKAINP
jgi:hypothetical protein